MSSKNGARITAGVIGVGAMGKHHARVYNEIRDCELVGIADADPGIAGEVADEYGTDVYDTEELLERADAVSIAVPTPYHYELARRAIDAGTGLLVEKPFVENLENGRELIRRANDAGVTLQVGHIERFNPVTDTLRNVLQGLNVISVSAERLGPPPERTISDSAVTDLMIHDIDIICSVLDTGIASVSATGNANGRHATATIEFEDDTIGRLTASRVTQRKVRKLTITAEESYVIVDYLDQSIEIHRDSVPEFVEDDGDVMYRHESIVENPAVDNGEPLKHELRSFAEAVRDGQDPTVTGEDGLRAVELAQTINQKSFGDEQKTVEVLQD